LAGSDHVLFEAGPEFLYGYGMDRAGRSRGLPDIRAKIDAKPAKKKKARK
jgi:hypoxanthine-guanine phosphoribosyltransferase